MWSNALRITALWLALVFAWCQPWRESRADVVSGGPYRIVGSTANGGVSTGGPYAIQGKVTSSSADTVRGEAIQLTGEVIAAYQVALGNLSLHVELAPDGLVRLRWPMGIRGYQLEFADTLETPGFWQPVDLPLNDNTLILGANQAARFFRLRRL